MQFTLTGILLPSATALNAIIGTFASCRKVFDYRMQYTLIFADFWISHAVANLFLQATKRNLIPFIAETKRGK
jgi:hypothetical protein